MSETKLVALPKIARYKPYYKELEANKTYFWCACGLSQNQPYCDGSHKGTDILPVRYKASENEEVLFCGCKHTLDAPFCDGAHNNLKDEYETDDPNSAENLAIPEVQSGDDGLAWLNGGCFVAKLDDLEKQQVENLTWAPIVNHAKGAKFQSLFLLEVDAGTSPVMGFGERDVILLRTQGQGSITISSKDFNLDEANGIYVRPGEQFSFENTGSSTLKVIAAVCPMAEAPEFAEQMTSTFESEFPDRTIGIDRANAQSMANRFFQILVDKSMGSKSVTQFIGDIPMSKAAPHRHLYEETLVILKGEGCMWTEDKKTRVNAGDVIFLPRKQLHSLECTHPDGMMLAGVIYPGDNPSINY
jgi:mannose-6-phosphate isomerase-like protein (cupin superfamily)/CDGSH-type Zn-finger protein